MDSINYSGLWLSSENDQPLPLAPSFSWGFEELVCVNRFSGFHPERKPLKRLTALILSNYPAKAGC